MTSCTASAVTKTTVVLGTATPGGGFPAYGNPYAQTLNETDASLQIAPRNTKGSTENVPLLERDFSPHGKIAQSLKDVHLMLEQAQRLGQELPLAQVNAEVMEACVRQGEGEWDNCAVIEEIRRRRK